MTGHTTTDPEWDPQPRIALGKILDTMTGHTKTGPAELDRRGPAAWRQYHLDRITAATTLIQELSWIIAGEAYLADVDGAPATYADLGAAAGISRQAARERWPGAIRHARPGRPRIERHTP